MKYMQSWQDFMKQPENKALKESKGIHACKQKFIQEQNKMMWDDPIILQENGAAAEPTAFAAAGGGGNNGFITGDTAEVSTFTWTSGIDNGITGSAVSSAGADRVFSVTLEAMPPNATDFSAGHTQVRKKIGIFFTTGSGFTANSGNGISTTGLDCVVTASCFKVRDYIFTANHKHVTGAWGSNIIDNLANQAATATVLGFTNTIAPSTLISATTSSGGETIVFTNAVAGGNTDATTDVAATTGSIATTTQGLDKFAENPGYGTFDGQVLPFSNEPYNTTP